MVTVQDQTAANRGGNPEKPHLSYSAIDEYMRCGKLFQLHRVLGLEPDPSLSATAGKAVHVATELYDRLLFAETGQ